MLKTTKKLTLNKEKLRVLTDATLERVAGGWINTTGSGWCSSSAYAKCGGGGIVYGCTKVDAYTNPLSGGRSALCVNP
jgi:hypothetical protein